MSWKTRANCRGRGDLDWDGWSSETAAVCAPCRVKAECLLEALGEPETAGTWGFTNEAQRRQLRAKKTTVGEVWNANLQSLNMLESDESDPVRDAPSGMANVIQLRLG